MPASPTLSKSGADIFRNAVLGWYDRHRRTLPWRAAAGVTPDPYYVWLSEIMLQQTTVGAVAPYFTNFIERWPNVGSLAAAADEDVMGAWAGLGYYSRARNLLKCARTVISAHNGRFPSSVEDLKTLPGIGPYTASAIAAIAFNRSATVIDGNVERVIARFHAIEEPLPAAKKAIRTHADSLSRDRADRPGDFAQGMMDLGAAICIPRTPRCALCPLVDMCSAYKRNLQNELPRRAQKAPRPLKIGYVYWLDDGAGNILLHRRPPNGLLGGMAALPSSEWSGAEKGAPVHPDNLQKIRLNIRRLPGAEIRHVFTHFELRLTPFTGRWPRARAIPRGYYWAPLTDADNWGLPSLFKKTALLMIK